MATLLLNFLIVFVFCVAAEFHCCSANAHLPIVRNISELEEDNYGVPGLSHITIAGSLMHGFKEVEIFLEMAIPGSTTPIHRHSCEEIFLVIRGTGTLYLASDSGSEYPGNPKEFPFFPNSTFHIPDNVAHQIVNTNEHEDLQCLVIISRPPIKAFIYDDWFMPHADAKLLFPSFWDRKFYQETPLNDEL